VISPVLRTTLFAQLSQQGERSPAHVLDGKAVLAQQDVAGHRRAEPIDAQYIATIPDVAMPALRRACFDGKPRADRRRQEPVVVLRRLRIDQLPTRLRSSRQS
jgi:hypothetical protein